MHRKFGTRDMVICKTSGVNMSYQTVIDRCHNKVKNPFALDGFTYQFEK